MPPRFKFSREEIIDTATALVRECGITALSARSLATALGTSTKPIFGLFTGMDEVRESVIERSKLAYKHYVDSEISSGKYPLYKAYGMGYIRFAMEDAELFKLLYMRDRSNEVPLDDKEALAPLLDIISSNTGLNRDTAYILHLEIWLFIHGIATTIVTNYGKWDMDFIDRMINDQYIGLTHRLLGEKDGSN